MADLAADLRCLREPGAPRLIAGRRRRLRSVGIVAIAAALVTGLVAAYRWRSVTTPSSPDSLAVMSFENLSDPSDADNLGRMLAALLETEGEA